MTHCHEQFHVTSYAFFAGTIHVMMRYRELNGRRFFRGIHCVRNVCLMQRLKTPMWGVNGVIVSEIRVLRAQVRWSVLVPRIREPRAGGRQSN